MRSYLIAILVAAALALVAGAPAASAVSRGPCLPGTSGPQCFIWTVKVIAVHDGDTFDARVEGKRKRIRMTGINAMEHSVYARDPRRRRGDCHALEATARLERLIKAGGRKVRLVAQDPRSRSGARLRRAVYARIRGQWVDLGRVLLSEGHTLWLPAKSEWAWNGDYGVVAAEAAARRLLLWDTDYCGTGPDEGVPLSVFVNWDARGNDSANVNGEFVEIRNFHDSRSVSLAGWLFRDSAHRQYDFPPSATVPAGGSITVHVGVGTDTADVLYWGQREPIFENVAPRLGLGDGGYLYDPQGDLRAWHMYPCEGASCETLGGGATPGGGEALDDGDSFYR
jgi:micrococcal nuclease